MTDRPLVDPAVMACWGELALTRWQRLIEALTEDKAMTEKREYSRDEPVALDDRDPSNTDPDQLTAPLDPDDDVFALVSQEQGDLLETAPMHEPTDGD